MDSEKIATNHVELAISKAGHLVSHINSNDKEPSWDGDVEVYKKSGHVHAKADLILKVPVQVKGHIKPNLKKKSIKYSIQYSDLRNYLYVEEPSFLSCISIRKMSIILYTMLDFFRSTSKKCSRTIKEISLNAKALN